MPYQPLVLSGLPLRARLLSWLAIATAATLASLLLPSLLLAAEPHNIVLIVADDLGMQVGAYGDKVVKTPAIDALAREGTRFTRAYCTTASCSASRAVILSGQHNHATAHYGLAHGAHHFSAYAGIPTLPVVLAAGGYRTCSIGKYHVAPEAVFHFDVYANEGTDGHRNGVAMAANARKFIEATGDQPFFLYFCSADPHRDGVGGFGNRAYQGCKPVVYDPADIVVPPWLPDNDEARKELAEFYQAISRFDEGVGALVQVLKDTNKYDQTLLLLISDNGPPFPGAKTNQYEPGIHLPLIIRRPQQKPAVVNDALVNWTDLMPTILEFANIAPSSALGNSKPRPEPVLHGRSILPVLEEAHPVDWNRLHASHTFHEITMYYPMRTLRDGNLKYIFNIAHQLPYPFASDLHGSRTWQGVLKRGDKMYGNRSVQQYVFRPRHELYDLDNDPHELNNLATDPRYAEQLAKLQEQMRAWQKKTNDPWLAKWEYE